MFLDRYLLLYKRRNGTDIKTHGIEIIDHFAQDGLTPLFSDKVDNWSEDQFEIWSDYHNSVCREESIMGASNHVIIVGRKQ